MPPEGVHIDNAVQRALEQPGRPMLQAITDVDSESSWDNRRPHPGIGARVPHLQTWLVHLAEYCQCAIICVSTTTKLVTAIVLKYFLDPLRRVMDQSLYDHWVFKVLSKSVLAIGKLEPNCHQL